MTRVELVLNYINGEDLGEYNVEDLENSKGFMLDVLNYTKDPRMYKFCSSSLKSEHTFILGVIEIFKDDYKFVKQVASDYLSTLKVCEREDNETEEEFEDRLKRMEINILLSNLGGREVNRFSVGAAIDYSKEEEKIKKALEYITSLTLKKEVGMGFLLILDQYGSSKIICDYFAKRMLSKIFYEDDIEKFVHSRFKKFEDLEEIGENRFIIETVQQEFDSYLGSYLQYNLPLIEEVKQEVRKVGSRWDNYMTRLNEERVSIFETEFSRYLKNNADMGIVDIDSISKYVAVTLGVEDTFIKYDPLYESDAAYEEVGNSCEFRICSARKFALGLGKILFEKDSIDTEKLDKYLDDSTEQSQYGGVVVPFRIVK